MFDSNNVPVQSGNVNIIYPTEVASGVVVGNFSPTTSVILNGIATFNYTGPDDLLSLIKAGYSGTSFEFYYENDITKAVKLSITYDPDPDQIVITSYKILFQPQNGSLTMSLKEIKPFSIAIVDKDNNLVADANINELNISLENIAIASLMDSSGNKSSTLNYTSQNNITASLISSTISGLIPLHVSGSFIDVNNNTVKVEDTFNIIVQSGPPTAISLSYIETDQDTSRAKFIEKFAISVTDKYFNPVNTNPNVSVGAIVGYANYDDDKSHRIFVDSNPLATLDNNSLNLNQNLIQTTSDIDIYNDTLVTFGNGYTYPASGGWDFNEFNTSSIILNDGQFDGNTTANLGYAIGHNFRQDACILGTEWLGQTKLQDGVTTLDAKGTAVIELSYDYYLVGKDIVLYANIVGQDNQLDRKLKIGEAQKRTLRGHGVEVYGDLTITTETNTSKIFYAWVKDTSEPYRNARFEFKTITESGNGEVNSTIHMPIEDCNGNNGHAYVEYSITADANSTFGISLENPVISSEF